MESNTFIGLDVHKASISVAVARGERGGEVRHWGSVPNRPDHIRKLVEKLAASGAQLRFCYEAGPCGYGLHRQLVEMGHDCIVVAPSLIPLKAGDRVKTDRRDALMLAKLPPKLKRKERQHSQPSLTCPCVCVHTHTHTHTHT